MVLPLATWGRVITDLGRAITYSNLSCQYSGTRLLMKTESIPLKRTVDHDIVHGAVRIPSLCMREPRRFVIVSDISHHYLK